MLQPIKNVFIFLLLGALQIHFGGNFFVKPTIDFLLIFLIFLFFNSPLACFGILLVMRGIIFDAASGLTWGTHLLGIIFAFGIGFFLLKFLESDNFFSRLIIGESIIFVYFLIIFLSGLLISHLNLWLIVLIDFFLNSAVYLAIMALNKKIKARAPSH